jgi:acylphosphatase
MMSRSRQRTDTVGEQMVHAHVTISGRVQGVCFRMYTQDQARRLGVDGWVRNTFDGAVEAVFEGPKQDVEKVVRWCHEGPPAALVHDVDVRWGNYSGEFDRFSITY